MRVTGGMWGGLVKAAPVVLALSWFSSVGPAGAQSNAGNVSITYNDGARSQTTVIFGLGSEVATFDRNGSPETVVRDTGVGPVTTTTTVTSTANVCK